MVDDSRVQGYVDALREGKSIVLHPSVRSVGSSFRPEDWYAAPVDEKVTLTTGRPDTASALEQSVDRALAISGGTFRETYASERRAAVSSAIKYANGNNGGSK